VHPTLDQRIQQGDLLAKRVRGCAATQRRHFQRDQYECERSNASEFLAMQGWSVNDLSLIVSLWT
jgi:hypothetical protein